MDGGDDGDRLLTTFTLDRSVVLEWTGIATVGFLVALFVLGWLYSVATGSGATEVGSGELGFGSIAAGILGTVALLAVVIVAHELVHGAVIRYYGGDVSFGVGVAGFVMPYAYATTTHRLTRNQFVAVALAPLVVLTTVGFALVVASETLWLLVPLAFNVAGAIGDCWMAVILLRYPPHVVVEDSVTGLRIYGREDDRPLPATGGRRFLRRVLFGTGVGFGLLFLVAMLGPIVLSAFGVDSLSLGQPGTPWSVFAFEVTPDGGFESSVNPVGLFGASLLVGVLLAIVSVPWRSKVAD